MSPRTRRRLIAVFAALCAAWVLSLWWSWLPRGVAEIVVTPGAAPLSGREPVRWRFNLDMVDGARIGSTPTVAPMLTPVIAGGWCWEDARTLRFQPAQDWPLGETIAVELPGGALAAASGFRLEQPLGASLVTAPATVRAVRQVGFAADGTYDLELELTRPLAAAGVAERLVATAADAPATAIPVALVPTETAGTRVLIRLGPAPALDGGRVRLAWRLAAPGGAAQHAADRDWSTEVAVGHGLRVTAAHTRMPALGDAEIRLVLAGGEPHARLASAVTVDPPVSFTVEDTAEALILRGAFACGASYALTVPAQWPVDGVVAGCAAPFAATVVIPDREPRVAIVPTPGMAQRGALPALAVETMNLPAIALRLVPEAGGEPQSPLTLAIVGERNQAVTTPLPLADLVRGRAAGRYRLEVGGAAEPAAVARIPIVLDDHPVPAGDLAASWLAWARAALAGQPAPALRLRVVRVAD